MSAHTLGSTSWEMPAPSGGSGIKVISGTGTCTASYDTGGSTFDLSSLFASKVYYCSVNIDNASFRAQWVPGTSNASSDMKIFVDDNAGTQASSTDDLSTTPGTFEWFAIGTDA